MQDATHTIVEISDETDRVRKLVLENISGARFEWKAGAHVRVTVGDGKSTRAYSLLNLPELSPTQVAIGVLRDDQGQGGSRFMHELKVGDELRLSEPKNLFELEDHPGASVLLAGGIGITPIFSMARELEDSGRPYEVHYAGRTEGALAFVENLKSVSGDKLTLHYDDQDSALDIGRLLEAAVSDAHVYVCGPRGMIDAVRHEAEKRGFDKQRVHFELFSNDAEDVVNEAFEVEIEATGEVFTIPADKTIFEVLQDAGLDPLYDCLEGNCGLCQVDVIEGIPDHRDIVLSDEEKASNKVMQICVSRSKTKKLVIDL